MTEKYLADMVAKFGLSEAELDKMRRIVNEPSFYKLFVMYMIAKMVKGGDLSPAMLGIKEDDD